MLNEGVKIERKGYLRLPLLSPYPYNYIPVGLAIFPLLISPWHVR